MMLCLIFTLLCSVCLAKAEESPKIVEISKNQLVYTIGDSIELSCSVQYSQDYPVLWVKLNQGKPEDDQLVMSIGSTSVIRDSRISLREERPSRPTVPTFYKLKIKDAQISDTGIYKCAISMSTDKNVFQQIQVAVHSPPLINQDSPSTIVVRESNAVKVECYNTSTSDPYSISWKRENNAVFPTGETKYDGNVLKIDSVKQKDGGVYYCAASNGLQEFAKRKLTLVVEVPPHAQ